MLAHDLKQTLTGDIGAMTTFEWVRALTLVPGFMRQAITFYQQQKERARRKQRRTDAQGDIPPGAAHRPG